MSVIQFIQSHIEGTIATASGYLAGVINGVLLFTELNYQSIIATFVLGLVGGLGGLTVRLIWRLFFPKKKKNDNSK